MITECTECSKELDEDNDIYCAYCYRKAEDESYEVLEPEMDNCRICDRLLYLNEKGYCSRDCELGFTALPYQHQISTV